MSIATLLSVSIPYFLNFLDNTKQSRCATPFTPQVNNTFSLKHVVQSLDIHSHLFQIIRHQQDFIEKKRLSVRLHFTVKLEIKEALKETALLKHIKM